MPFQELDDKLNELQTEVGRVKSASEHIDEAKRVVSTRPTRKSRHVPVRNDRLQVAAHRPHGRPGHLRRHQALPDLQGLRGHLGHQHHRRR